MATPTYVAQKVGDQYILVPKDSASLRPIWGLGGGLLALLGFTRRSNCGLVMMIVGAAMACRGITGLSPWFRFYCSANCSDEEGGPQGAPSYQHSSPHVRQSPTDALDEAAMESFPASDPPAVGRSTGDGDVPAAASR